jgi:CYTH domain-containing protein
MFEIEHKYTLKTDGWKRENIITQYDIEQFYISTDPMCTMRVRCIHEVDVGNTQYIMTIKSSTGDMLVRRETEIEIDHQQYNELSAMSKWQPITKTRYSLFSDDYPTTTPGADNTPWMVDVFTGHLCGLSIAEIEVPSADVIITLPDWVGDEVTYDYRFTNSYFATTLPSKYII